MIRRLLLVLLGALVGLASGPLTSISALPVAIVATCSAPAPVGAANLPPDDPEPTFPIFSGPPLQCVAAGDLTQAPQTGHDDGHGGWIDDFRGGVSGNAPAHLANELGYTTQEGVSADGAPQTQHWIMNDYFGVDMAKTANFNGSDLSPNQTVRFEGGRLVLEADVAASIPGFADSSGGDVVWHEVVASTSQPLDSSNTADALYSYGYHRGHWTFGCRIQAARSLTCAVEADHDLASTTGDQFPCFSVAPARVMELSGHQQCGNVHSGFSVDFGAPASAWRVCPAGTVDPCLDRFRFEWSQAGFVAYVNGIKFAEDSGWPAASQLPASIVDGSTPLYVHYADWGDFRASGTFRFHWGRIAAQPHNPDGTLMAPSASPTFGQQPSPTPSVSPSATPRPSPTPTSFTCNLRYGGQGHPGSCVRQPDGSVLFRPS